MNGTLLARRRGMLGFAMVGLVLAGCEATGVVAPPSDGPLYNETGTPSLFPQEVTVCKTGPDGTFATFDITQTEAYGVVTTPVTVEATSLASPDVSKCARVWVATSALDPLTTLTITEREQPGLEVNSIVAFTDYYGAQTIENPAEPTYSVPVDWNNGAFVIFKNIEVDTPPPPGGGEGCTPGYWKQSQHFDSWTGYSPTDLFDTVFGRPAFPGESLLSVVGQGGGGLKALGRHAVAALLNASSADVSYDLSTTQVIGSFQAAFDSGSYEPTKNGFEAFNEQGCPLN